MTAEPLSSRDPRKLMSKSFLVAADLCGNKAWLELNDPRPFRMNERVAFGSAVDLGVQLILGAWEAGLELVGAHEHRLLDPLLEQINAHPEEARPDLDEVVTAVRAFRTWIDETDINLWNVKRQHHIRIPVDGIGMIDAHPDLITADNRIIDVKTSSRAKPADAAAKSFLELGFYALIREIETGERVPAVGYLTWIRSSRPSWQLVMSPVTDRMLELALRRATLTARAVATDAMLNEGAREPVNYTFPGGPRFSGMCGDCHYNPALGGSCRIAEGD